MNDEYIGKIKRFDSLASKREIYCAFPLSAEKIRAKTVAKRAKKAACETC